MKKMIFMISAALTLGAFADELSTDVLMWYINLGSSPDPTVSDEHTTFSTLNFFLRSTTDPSAETVNLNNYTHLFTSGGSSDAGIDSGINANGRFAGVYVTDLSSAGNDAGITDWSTYEFMMALENGGNLVAWSSTLFNSQADQVLLHDLQTANAVYNRVEGGDLNPTAMPSGVTPYNFGPNVVPEPTGGLLMLVGGALLALRRKRKVF